ncbi:hypothetical protein ABZT45_30650 [Streptomyces sp. NPDC005356]|uniref:hypothetical protein n=1 Tax=Streptomyces sp. NPDC005356 TaxID=3157167 RepID=UPI0033A699FD
MDERGGLGGLDLRRAPREHHLDVVDDTDAEGGRGTELLDALAEAWGNLPTAIGKTIWFELVTKVAAP